MGRGVPHGRDQARKAKAQVSAPGEGLSTRQSADAFILENTKLVCPPLVPEIRLHLAVLSVPIWLATEDELGQLNLPPPYWAFAWAGGQALARYLLDNPTACAGQTVTDLGAGSGLTAIAAVMSGAQRVLAADIDGIALAACGLNATANNVSFKVTGADLLGLPPQAAHVVLIGDLFYERELGRRVLDYIEAAKLAGCVVLIGDPQRNYFPRDRFTQIAEFEVPVTRDLEDAEIKRTAVWRA